MAGGESAQTEDTVIDVYVAWMILWAAGLVACYWAGFRTDRTDGPR